MDLIVLAQIITGTATLVVALVLVYQLRQQHRDSDRELSLDSLDLVQNFRINELIYSLIILFISFHFFNYSPEFTGGGIFFKLSFYLFQNIYLFFLISLLSCVVILNTFKINLNNFLLLVILIISNPQLTIYHKYFDPLLIILFFLFFDFKFSKEIFFNKKFLLNIFIFYFSFLLVNFGRLII